jgi:hypothetical protein
MHDFLAPASKAFGSLISLSEKHPDERSSPRAYYTHFVAWEWLAKAR